MNWSSSSSVLFYITIFKIGFQNAGCYNGLLYVFPKFSRWHLLNYAWRIYMFSIFFWISNRYWINIFMFTIYRQLQHYSSLKKLHWKIIFLEWKCSPFITFNKIKSLEIFNRKKIYGVIEDIFRSLACKIKVTCWKI